MRKILALLPLVALSLTVGAATIPKKNPIIYISASDGFDTAIAAAIQKKHVPVTITTEDSAAEYRLEAAPVMSHEESAGSKVARCLFLDCIGMNGNSAVSVSLIKESDHTIVWSYQVRKAMSGPLGIQSLSEAIAKHLKNDYLSKHKES